ncbi:DEAD-box ATP-dependent RNA helicase 7-like [Agrilus planipennis]|uniref:DEAD-box ATP-dependent RNA helicase 7-like n=1 Tax=Agrilus planipennis TaxID=224129 RepID=A0A1W4WNB0_AGRPL|nr:DEAD-box ATP-dependent RNA helicase 7-like [Agrilus planipennis]
MAVRISFVLVVAFAASVYSMDFLKTPEVRLAVKVLDECSRSDGFSLCMKKRALTVLDRLGRMDKFTLFQGLDLVRVDGVRTTDNTISEDQLEKSLPRSADEKETALNTMLMDKLTTLMNSRNLQFTMPIADDESGLEEGRKKKGNMMSGMMIGIAGKMAAMIPIAIAGLFLLAGKALITAKIALLLSGIIALKKLFASKNSGGGGGGGGGGGHGGWQSGGGGGGWQSSGGGWDKRSLETGHKLAYKAYSPK